MSFSNTTEGIVLDALVGSSATLLPSTLYVGLFTAAPDEDGAGTELSGNNYSRASVVRSAFTRASNTSSNNVDITFATASGAWSTATHFAIFSAVSGGTCYFIGSLNSSVTVGSGVTLKILSGNLSISLD